MAAVYVFGYGVYAITTQEINIKYVQFQGTDAVIGGVAHIILSVFVGFALYKTRDKK